jgi:hypothetical protein
MGNATFSQSRQAGDEMKRLKDKSDLVLTDMAEGLVIELTDVLAIKEVGSFTRPE